MAFFDPAHLLFPEGIPDLSFAWQVSDMAPDGDAPHCEWDVHGVLPEDAHTSGNTHDASMFSQSEVAGHADCALPALHEVTGADSEGNSSTKERPAPRPKRVHPLKDEWEEFTTTQVAVSRLARNRKAREANASHLATGHEGMPSPYNRTELSSGSYAVHNKENVPVAGPSSQAATTSPPSRRHQADNIQQWDAGLPHDAPHAELEPRLSLFEELCLEVQQTTADLPWPLDFPPSLLPFDLSQSASFPEEQAYGGARPVAVPSVVPSPLLQTVLSGGGRKRAEIQTHPSDEDVQPPQKRLKTPGGAVAMTAAASTRPMPPRSTRKCPTARPKGTRAPRRPRDAFEHLAVCKDEPIQDCPEGCKGAFNATHRKDNLAHLELHFPARALHSRDKLRCLWCDEEVAGNVMVDHAAEKHLGVRYRCPWWNKEGVMCKHLMLKPGYTNTHMIEKHKAPNWT